MSMLKKGMYASQFPVGDGDPYWDKVVALLHFENNILDEITSNVWTSPNPQFDNGVFNRCVKFNNNTSSILSLPYNSKFNLSDQDFTLEMYIKKTGSIKDYAPFFGRAVGGDNNQRSFYIYFLAQKLVVTLIKTDNTSFISFSDTLIFPLNQWVHLAITRFGDSFYVFIDGVLKYENSGNGSIFEGNFPMYIGSGTGQPINNLQLDELRITKGVARYTENFTPPTEPFPNY